MTIISKIKGERMNLKKLGLDAGLFWNNFKDSPHVQLRKVSNPAKVFSLQEIDQTKTMELRFG